MGEREKIIGIYIEINVEGVVEMLIFLNNVIIILGYGLVVVKV